MTIVNADLDRTKLEYAKACEGIRNPRVVTLRAGVALFRLASARNPTTGEETPSDLWTRSPWWLFEHDYHKIIKQYRKGSSHWVPWPAQRPPSSPLGAS